MKKLSICIPTFNRSNLLLSQLEFLSKEITVFRDVVDVIVADNFSDKIHRDKLIEYHKINSFFELKLNESNLGSIGNIYYLLSLADTEYVWFVSDDDILLEGVITRLLFILNSKPVNHVFLNHSAFIDNPEIIDHSVDLLGYDGYYENGKQSLINLFVANGTVSMFMTACVYSTSLLKSFYSVRNVQTLIDPLLFSFKLADGPIYIEKDVFVLERCLGFSWINESLAIFSWQVQGGLIELVQFSYSRLEVHKMVISLYKTNLGNYLRMLLQSPMVDRKKIVSFLGWSQLFLIIPSLIFNIKRLFIRVIQFCNFL